MLLRALLQANSRRWAKHHDHINHGFALIIIPLIPFCSPTLTLAPSVPPPIRAGFVSFPSTFCCSRTSSPQITWDRACDKHFTNPCALADSGEDSAKNLVCDRISSIMSSLTNVRITTSSCSIFAESVLPSIKKL